MSDIVISIGEILDFQIRSKPHLFFDGYEVRTTGKTYRVLIENSQNCNEHWGYFSSHDDDFDRFLCKQLTGVYLTDTALDKQKVDSLHLECGDIQFVDFCFSDGDKFQLAVYNAHNGYYGHKVLVLVGDDILKEDRF